MEFVKESRGEHGEAHGTTTLYVDEEAVASGPMRTQLAQFTLCGDGLCVGRDSADAVSKEYTSPARFKGGTILQVEVNVGDDQYIDLEKRSRRDDGARIGEGAMTDDTVRSRNSLPIPDIPAPGLTTYDAKDPDTTYPADPCRCCRRRARRTC